jgi:hypothetical protein
VLWLPTPAVLARADESASSSIRGDEEGADPRPSREAAGSSAFESFPTQPRGTTAWFETDWGALLDAFRARSEVRPTLLWLNERESNLAGVPSVALQEQFARAGVRILLCAGVRDEATGPIPSLFPVVG